MNEDKIKVIKIGQEAILEFLHEALIEKTGDFLDTDPTTVISHFDFDFERGELVFCAVPDTPDNIVTAPKIDTQVIMKNIPDTASSLFDGSVHYREFTEEELNKLVKDTENT